MAVKQDHLWLFKAVHACKLGIQSGQKAWFMFCYKRAVRKANQLADEKLYWLEDAGLYEDAAKDFLVQKVLSLFE